jgi:3-phenylpropionate/trans-cinnamate dioxygenase ferredoxin subunit
MRHVVAKLSDVEAGRGTLVEVAGREIALFNVNGEYFGISNRCPHGGASLCRGTIIGLADSSGPGDYRLVRQGEMLKCPWHGWEFDIRTGKSWCDPARTKTKSYQVSVEAGRDLADAAYEVATYPIIVEEDYLVMDL